MQLTSSQFMVCRIGSNSHIYHISLATITRNFHVRFDGTYECLSTFSFIALLRESASSLHNVHFRTHKAERRREFEEKKVELRYKLHENKFSVRHMHFRYISSVSIEQCAFSDAFSDGSKTRRMRNCFRKCRT